MSIKQQKLSQIAVRIQKYHRMGTPYSKFMKRIFMLQHEVVSDDVAIRAESLSYFTLFSILPIIAGFFLAVSAVSQWAPLQDGFQNLIQQILEPLPAEHRKNLIQFIFEFKDQYLQKISSKGSSLGFFAVFVLLGIIGKVFLNLEDLMNRIWSARVNRSWMERFRNMVLTTVILPFSIFTALSLPGLVEKFGGVKLGVFVEQGVPALLLFGGLFFLFRSFPNVEVKTKNAVHGALLSSLLFFVSNWVLSIYFRFGTQTAYGKAAVIPLAAFFIYVSWFIIMIGAEWSFVLQNEDRFTDHVLDHPNLQEAALLLKVLEWTGNLHREGKTPATESSLCKKLGVTHQTLMVVLEFLLKKGIYHQAGTLTSEGESERVYLHSYDPTRINLVEIVKEFLEIKEQNQFLDVNQVIQMISAK